jgi:hypothetical protein
MRGVIVAPCTDHTTMLLSPEPISRSGALTFDKKREAEAELDRIRNKTREGTFVVPAKVALDERLDEWLRRRRST